MPFEDEGLPVSWEEIKAASRRIVGSEAVEGNEAEKRMAREYLAQTDFEDARVRENIAVPGYN